MGDDEYCVLYDNEDAFTSLVQIFLALLALGSLYVKRMHEIPRRKFMTWWLDVSKQGVGACYSHVANMMVAAIVANYSRGNYELKDECAWYGINFLIDTSVGLYFSVLLLDLLTVSAIKYNWESCKKCGVYEGEHGMRHWSIQLVAWLAILTITKFILVFIIWAFYPILARIGDFLFEPLQQNIKFELIFVMIFFPGFCNFFYFWIADHYLKAAPEYKEAHEPIEYTLSDYVTMSKDGSSSGSMEML